MGLQNMSDSKDRTEQNIRAFQAQLNLLANPTASAAPATTDSLSLTVSDPHSASHPVSGSKPEVKIRKEKIMHMTHLGTYPIPKPILEKTLGLLLPDFENTPPEDLDLEHTFGAKDKNEFFDLSISCQDLHTIIDKSKARQLHLLESAIEKLHDAKLTLEITLLLDKQENEKQEKPEKIKKQILTLSPDDCHLVAEFLNSARVRTLIRNGDLTVKGALLKFVGISKISKYNPRRQAIMLGAFPEEVNIPRGFTSTHLALLKEAIEVAKKQMVEQFQKQKQIEQDARKVQEMTRSENDQNARTSTHATNANQGLSLERTHVSPENVTLPANDISLLNRSIAKFVWFLPKVLLRFRLLTQLHFLKVSRETDQVTTAEDMIKSEQISSQNKAQSEKEAKALAEQDSKDKAEAERRKRRLKFRQDRQVEAVICKVLTIILKDISKITSSAAQVMLAYGLSHEELLKAGFKDYHRALLLSRFPFTVVTGLDYRQIELLEINYPLNRVLQLKEAFGKNLLFTHPVSLYNEVLRELEVQPDFQGKTQNEKDNIVYECFEKRLCRGLPLFVIPKIPIWVWINDQAIAYLIKAFAEIQQKLGKIYNTREQEKQLQIEFIAACFQFLNEFVRLNTLHRARNRVLRLGLTEGETITAVLGSKNPGETQRNLLNSSAAQNAAQATLPTAKPQEADAQQANQAVKPGVAVLEKEPIKIK